MNPVFPEVPRYEMDVYGIHTSYLMLGQGHSRSLLLLHGMSTAADSFRETIYGLASDFCLIAPDIPGFGFSADTRPYTYAHLVEWLATLRMALDLAPVALIGHSFGGTLAVAYALAYPDDVTRLILAAPSILGSDGYPYLLKRIAVTLGLLDLAAAISQSPLWLKRQIKSPFYEPERQDPSVWQRRLQDYSLSRAAASVLKASAFFDLGSSLSKIKVPVCLIWGENDPVLPPQDAIILQALLPNTEVHMLPECGHISILEQQVLFQAIVRQFLAR